LELAGERRLLVAALAYRRRAPIDGGLTEPQASRELICNSASSMRTVRSAETEPNERCSMDFIHDQVSHCTSQFVPAHGSFSARSLYGTNVRCNRLSDQS